ncbi:heat shock factor protein 5-like isoform X2 [Schistocerca gregaria]|uniref:heat shock factor protein 5-like isoform X2 n=1 Tax=Schistocerca gregaria TaxID=7010 RepID=UPI00211DF751|nr:heat shock factor protein 5-like isoform X2 [Schistocerca gregaria]
MTGDTIPLLKRFPQKLWDIINNCESDAIRWGQQGRSIVVDYNVFRDQYLNCTAPLFKTRNITSFVRQLNLYGFRKIVARGNPSGRSLDVHEFQHKYFRLGREDLLVYVTRNYTKPLEKLEEIKIENPLSVENETKYGSTLMRCRQALEEALERAVAQYNYQRKLLMESGNISDTSSDSGCHSTV